MPAFLNASHVHQKIVVNVQDVAVLLLVVERMHVVHYGIQNASSVVIAKPIYQMLNYSEMLGTFHAARIVSRSFKMKESSIIVVILLFKLSISITIIDSF